MPFYEYEALNELGRSVKGSVEADNIRAARSRLKAMGLFPTEVRESVNRGRASKRDFALAWRIEWISRGAVAAATRQLATLVVAGIPLVEALQAVAEQCETLPLKRVLNDVREQVQAGSSFAKALQKHPRVFTRLFVNMSSAGETSGNLDTVLENLADYLEQQLELRQKVTSSLFYPTLMLIFCITVVLALLTFIVPRIVDMFTKQGAILPLPTRILIFISDALLSYWYVIITGLIITFYFARRYYRKKEGKARIDRLLLRSPIIGGLHIKLATAKIAATLGALLSSGVGLLEAIDIAKSIVSNVHVVEALEAARDGVREGRSFAREIAKSKLFPNLFPQMVAIGERSGELEKMLVRAGKTYQREVDTALEGLTTLIEPLMIIGLGGIVFAVVIALLLPMVNLIDILQK